MHYNSLDRKNTGMVARAKKYLPGCFTGYRKQAEGKGKHCRN